MPSATNYERALDFFRRGDLEQSRMLCLEILGLDRRHAAALHLLGLIALQRGDFARSIPLLRQSLAVNPRQPDVHANLGSALLRAGQPQAALESCEAALVQKPDYVDAWNNHGNALRALGRSPESLQSYARALVLAPRRADTRHLRGRLLLELDRVHEALDDFDRALEFGMVSPAVYVNRGNALFRLGRPEAALASYERALALAPQDADALFNRGNALLRLDRWSGALACYDAVLRLRPTFAKALYHRGNALRRLRDPHSALASFGRAVEISPAYVEAVCGLGNARRDLGDIAGSLAAYDEALAVDPDCQEALSNRGRALVALGRPTEATVSLERLFRLAPDTAADCHFALGHLVYSRLLCCDWTGYTPSVAALVAAVQAGRRVTLPPLLLACCDAEEVHLRCARDFVADNWTSAGIAPWSGARPRHARIRIAYVSADLRQHPVAQLMAAVIEAHDRERVEVFGVALRSGDDSALGRRIRAAFDHLVDVSGQTDEDAAALLRGLEIDIAVDLTGYTEGCRPGIFARRAAPIQVNYLGYPGTLAASYIDYLIADRVVVPESARRFYSEHIVYLPGSFQPNDAGRALADTALARADHGLPAGGFVFCCFNNHYKLQPPMFDIWMRLLKNLDGSVLWLTGRGEEARAHLRSAAEGRGVSAERLVFAERVASLDDHLARYALADLFLDTLPYNAHTTASDALWGGLPVLTCRGGSFAARVAASLLENLGLPELITDSLEEYESRAAALAARPAELARLRARLKANRTSSGLFDTGRLTRHLETAYAAMWARWQDGRGPESFDVKPPA